MRQTTIIVVILLITGANWIVIAGDNSWTPIGPDGGTVYSVAIDPSDPSTLFAASYYGGLFRSTNGAASWALSNAGLPDTILAAVAVSPHDPNLILVASRARQVYKSTDAGQSFSLSSGGISEAVSGGINSEFMFHPTIATTVYWHWYTGDCSIYLSTDGGANWACTAAGLPENAQGLLIDPATPLTLFARLSNEGIYKTIDGGATWNPANTGLPLNAADPPKPPVNALTLDPAEPSRLFAASGVDGKLYVTTNGGNDWTLADDAERWLHKLWHHPTNGRLYGVMQDNGGANPSRRDCIWTSSNDGETWTNLTADHYPSASILLAFDPVTSTTLYATISEGIYKSLDSGTSWDPASSGFRGMEVQSVTFSPSLPSTYYIGGSSGMFRTTDDGQMFTPINDGLALPRGEAMIVHPTEPLTVFGTGETPNGPYISPDWPPPDSGLLRSTNGGDTWTAIANPAYADFGFALTQVWDLEFEPGSSDNIFAASPGYIYPDPYHYYAGGFRSNDSGVTFEPIVNGLPDSTIVFAGAVAVAPGTPDPTLYLGMTSPPGLYQSTNGGDLWTDISIGTDFEGAGIYDIAVHPTIPSTVYISAREHGVLVSLDSGATWNPSSTGLPDGSTPWCLAIDPQSPNLLFLADTSTGNEQPGVWWSSNGGASWQPLRSNMGDMLVWELAVDPGTPGHVLAGTRHSLWEINVDPNLLFADGFETGDTSVWSKSVR